MACTSPITAYRAKRVNDSGKRSLVFNRQAGFADMPVTIDCGHCIACRITRARTWALRCVHESKLHFSNCFITLTYDEQHAPPDKSVCKRELQLFFKRLRKAGISVRYFACAEYGDTSLRPHYHAILFGEDFTFDRKVIKRSGAGPLYTSETLRKIWGNGHVTIASFSYSTAAYVASYVIKKRTGENSHLHDDYSRLDALTGEIFYVTPEFVLMSRRPGLGSQWYEKFKTDAFPSDFLIHQEKKFGVPRYYFNKLQKENLPVYTEVRGRRRFNLQQSLASRHPDRLDAKRAILISKQSLKKRSI